MVYNKYMRYIFFFLRSLFLRFLFFFNILLLLIFLTFYIFLSKNLYFLNVKNTNSLIFKKNKNKNNLIRKEILFFFIKKKIIKKIIILTIIIFIFLNFIFSYFLFYQFEFFKEIKFNFLNMNNVSYIKSKFNNINEINNLILNINNLIFNIKKYFNNKFFFISSIVHDLRIPLTRIYFILEIIINKNNKNYINLIKENIDECDFLMKIFLKYLEIDYRFISFKKIDLNFLLNQVINLEKNNSIKIENFISSKEIILKVNYLSIKRVVINIIRNAINYGNSWIRITSGCSKNKKNNYAWFKIEDNGPGISKDKLKFLFYPFITQKKKKKNFNTGLGLAIVKYIIEQHKGKIKTGVSIKGGFLIKIYLPKN